MLTSSCKEEQQQSLPHLTYRPDIDGLRAIAVILVISFHAFPGRIRGGFIGVDIFFVISGYLITSLILQDLAGRRFSFADFYSRRIRRIFPALFTVLAAVLIFGWFALLPDEYRQLGKHVAGGAGFISNLILWKESGYFDIASELKPLLHLWSLGIEEQYYILWPLFLYLLSKKRYNLLSGTILILLISFGINLALYKKHPVADFYFPGSRFWELLAGATLAYLTLYPFQGEWITKIREKRDKLLSSLIYTDKNPDREKTLWANLLSILGILLIAFAACKLTKDHPFPGKWAVLPVLGAILLITAGSSAWINKNILSRRLLVWIGLISYPLYLWHWPLLSFARIIEGETPSSLIRGGLVILSFVLAGLTYLLVERPIRFGQHRNLKVSILCVSILVIAAVGLGAWRGAFLPLSSTLGFEKIIKTIGEDAFKDPDTNPGAKNFEYEGGMLSMLPSNNEKKTLYIGDSFMEHYTARINHLILQNRDNTNSAVFAVHGGCPPILNVVGKGKRSMLNYPECTKRLHAGIKYAERPDVDTVVISSALLYYFSDTKEEEKYYYEDENFSGKLSDPEAAARAYHDLEVMLKNMVKSGKRTYFILNSPMNECFDPKNMIKRSLFPLGFKIEKREIPRQEFLNNLNYRETYKNLLMLGKKAGVHVIEPMDYLCPRGICPALWEDGEPMYRDSGHLRLLFVKENAMYLDETIIRSN